MGVINVTPDSFSDGGVHLRPERRRAEALGMLDEGAAIVDVGGESTRPGAEGVPLDEELRRVVPVLEALAGAPVSIDTAKAEVARRALELGAELVNDVTALRGDPELAGVVADAGAYFCLMHMRGEPRTMQVDPVYDDVVSEVKAFLEERLAFAVAAGHPRGARVPRPGIGFGKTVEHNFELVRRLGSWPRSGGRSCRLLAQELARADPGRSARRRPARRRRRSAPRSPPTSAARRSCACTTSASTSRRCASPQRGGARVKIELHGSSSSATTASTTTSASRASGSSTTSSSRSASAGANDRIEDAVDYSGVAAAVREVAAEQFACSRRSRRAIADAARGRFPPERVQVRVRKPEVRPAGDRRRVRARSRPSGRPE